MITAERYHDISCGHRVCGHEGKCSHLHGHNYRITFTCTGLQDDLGRIIDFSVIKSRLCQWLEDNWDHRFLCYEADPWRKSLQMLDPAVVILPFNPTAENIAAFIGEQIAPQCLKGTGVTLVRCKVEETRKCLAEWRLA